MKSGCSVIKIDDDDVDDDDNDDNSHDTNIVWRWIVGEQTGGDDDDDDDDSNNLCVIYKVPYDRNFRDTDNLPYICHQYWTV